MECGYYYKFRGGVVYDPGLDIDCPVCFKKLSSPITCVSITISQSDIGYFYRVHEFCRKNTSRKNMDNIERKMIESANKRMGIEKT